MVERGGGGVWEQRRCMERLYWGVWGDKEDKGDKGDNNKQQ